LWALLDSPLIGLIAALSIDIMAAIPTVRHAWREPHEEAASSYMLCAVAPLCFLAAMSKHTLMGLLYPIYLLAMNAAITAIILRAARPPVWFLLARRTPPSVAGHTHDSTLGQTLASAQALTYGRHAAGTSAGAALTTAASPPGPARRT
jgi:hypothetical protein